jgi:hypothetical protein
VSFEAAVIRHLALSEVELLERVASLDTDVASYRELVSVALEQIAALTARHTALREQHHRLIDECRRLRAHSLRSSGVAA